MYWVLWGRGNQRDENYTPLFMSDNNEYILFQKNTLKINSTTFTICEKVDYLPFKITIEQLHYSSSFYA